MSVVTVDYRVGKEAPAPAAIGDVRCAMAWVKANAAKYNFDLTPAGWSCVCQETEICRTQYVVRS
jgi:hypothetical protein